jgi:hypothetical protein
MVGVIHLFRRLRHLLRLSHARNTRVADATEAAGGAVSLVRFCGNVGSRERLGTFANVEKGCAANVLAPIVAVELPGWRHAPTVALLTPPSPLRPRSVLLPPFRRRFSTTSSFSEVNRQTQRLEGFADEFTAILSRQIDERR